MDEQLQGALQLIERACSAISADLSTHQQVQGALALVRDRLSEEPKSKAK